MKKTFRLRRKIEAVDIISIGVIFLLLAAVIFVFVVFMREHGIMDGDMVYTAERMRYMLRDFGWTGHFVIQALHITQVIVVAIPSALTQFIGGFYYGSVFWGVLTAQIGVFLGSIICLYLSKVFGKRVVSLFVSKKTLNKMDGLVSQKTSVFVLFAMFITPGFPHGILPYAMGLTKFAASKFFLISAVGRLPSMILTTYFGVHITDGNTTPVIIATIITFAIFILLYIFRNRLFTIITDKKPSKKQANNP